MPAGRPPKFSTQEELESQVKAYFVYIQGEYTSKTKLDDEGNEYSVREYTRDPEPATLTGLALSLGFESRQSIYDYEKNGEFSYTIKQARLMVENGYEKALFSRNPTGAIFALKNFGWSDKQEIDMRAKVGLTDQDTIFE